MISKTSPKSGIGDVDPFNKKKLAEEAKRDQDRIKENQKLLEKNKLQLQIDNRQRELAKLEADLKVKGTILAGIKRKIEDAKRSVFALTGEINRQENEKGYLSRESNKSGGQLASAEVELKKINAAAISAEREITDLETRRNNNQVTLNDLERKVIHLKDELAKTVAEAETIKKELAKNENEIKLRKSEGVKLTQKAENFEFQSGQATSKKSEKTKLAQTKDQEIKRAAQDLLLKKKITNQLEGESELAAQEITKLNQEKSAREQEINNLKRQKEQIR